MKPVNNKSLFHFIFDQMEKLDNNSIDPEKAKAQASLASQAHKCLMYEVARTVTQAKLESHNKEFNSSIMLREVETKNFD